MSRESESDWAMLYSAVAGMWFSGLFLVVTCLPVGYISAMTAGKDPIVAVLLLQSRGDIVAFVGKPSFSDFGAADISVISSLLSLYGVIALIAPLIFTVVKRGGYLKALTLSWGMILGLALTTVWFQWSNTGRIDWLAPSGAEIAYIYLAFLVAECGKISLEHKGILALPYFYAVDGAFGIVSVLIIHAGYSPSFSSLLLGPFFLVAVAIAILASEWVILRPLTIFFVGFGQALLDEEFERRLHALPNTWPRQRLLLSQIVTKTKEARRISYPARVKLIERAISSVVRKIPHRSKRSRLVRLDWRLAGGFFAFNLFFPLVVATLGWLLF